MFTTNTHHSWRTWAVIIALCLTVTSLLPSARSVDAAPSDHSTTAAASVTSGQQIRRRAVQLIEDQRIGGMTTTWKTARLGAVRTLFRPDLSTPAYYEFAVVSGSTPMGFIVLSTGAHDFPIAHWNAQGESPSAYLTRLAQSKGQAISRLYKLDALTYAAENSAGQLIGLYPPNSRLPTKIIGQTPAMLDQPQTLTHEAWTSTSDDEEAPGRHVRTQSGPAPNLNVKLTAWASWAELKTGFAASYQTMLLAHARQAKHDWDIDRAALQSGEGIVAGRGCRPVAATYDGVQATLSGVGAPFLTATVKQRTGIGPMIVVCQQGAPPSGGRAAFLTLKYSNGTSEVLRFVVLAKSAVDASSQAAQGVSARHTAAPLQGNWSAWTYYWAEGSSDQRYYQQISANTYNNTTSCYSGCGATAWAMLIGWADRQAATGNGYWAGREGLYRTNGGTTGSSTVAPQYMDTGVRNITMEIRYDIGTFCIAGSGATYPADMDGVASYLSGRTSTDEETHYHSGGLPTTRLREYARDSIRDNDTPAVIGTGWLTHYPLAWGYAWQSRTVNILAWQTTEYNRDFYVNQGWGGSGDGWVAASTWFAGELTP